MSDGIPYADLIILALIAGFILLRLRSILGNKMGNDNPSFFNKAALALTQEKQEPIVQLDEKSLKPKVREEADAYLSTLDNSLVAKVLNDIKSKDAQFNATRFLEGAKGAFEMAFDAFAKGDRNTLKMLLSDGIYQEFIKELAVRDAKENKAEITLVSVKAKEIPSASLTGTTAHISVHFESEQVNLVRNSKGEIIEGDVSEIHHIEDHWTFERDITAKNPNWKIIET